MIRTFMKRSVLAISIISVRLSKNLFKLKSYHLLWRSIHLQASTSIRTIKRNLQTLIVSQLLKTITFSKIPLITVVFLRKRATMSSISTRMTPSQIKGYLWLTQLINNYKSLTFSLTPNQNERFLQEASSRSKILANSNFNRLKRALVATILQPFDIYSLLSIWTFKPRRQICLLVLQQKLKQPTYSCNFTFPHS